MGFEDKIEEAGNDIRDGVNEFRNLPPSLQDAGKELVRFIFFLFSFDIETLIVCFLFSNQIGLYFLIYFFCCFFLKG